MPWRCIHFFLMKYKLSFLEREYWPYWNPTQWKDIALITDDLSRCSLVNQSQNIQDKFSCVPGPNYNSSACPFYPINATECSLCGGAWKTFNSWSIAAPKCISFNSLTYDVEDGRMGYLWSVPTSEVGKKCIIRVRLNQTFGERTPELNASNNPACQPNCYDTLFKPDGLPTLDMVVRPSYNAIFQDRSYVFLIKAPPAGSSTCSTIWNLSTVGRRGNYASIFPSLLYSFTPSNLVVKQGECIHIHWIGKISIFFFE